MYRHDKMGNNSNEKTTTCLKSDTKKLETLSQFDKVISRSKCSVLCYLMEQTLNYSNISAKFVIMLVHTVNDLQIQYFNFQISNSFQKRKYPIHVVNFVLFSRKRNSSCGHYIKIEVRKNSKGSCQHDRSFWVSR